jgi:hypothetical protein
VIAREPSSARFRRYLVVAVVLVLGGSACGNPLDGGTVEEERTDRYDGVTSLVVGHEVGSIEIVGGSQLAVDRTVRSSGGREPTERVVQDGSTLTVGADCPASFGASTCAVDYRITAPSEVDIIVRAQANAVRATDVASRVDVSTDSGRIDISGVSADVRTSTQAGETSISLDDPATVQASSDSGAIGITFGAPSTGLVASSASGDLTVTVPADSGPYLVTAESTTGRTAIAVPQAADGVPFDLRTDNGAITVTTS